MKSILLFVAASLILVVAMVAVAIPNTVQAAPKHNWCQDVLDGECFKTKGECKKTDVGAQFGCFKNNF